MQNLGIPLPLILETPPDPPWIYDPWLTEWDEIMFLNGDPGVGKTTFIGNLMFSLASGRPFLGSPMQGEPKRIAYLDLDMGENMIRRNFSQTFEALGIGKDEAAVLDERVAVVCRGNEWGDSLGDKIPDGGMNITHDRKHKVIANIIERSNADIVVIESWTDFCSGAVELNDAGQTSRAFSYLKGIKPGVNYWIVHHNTKSRYEAGGKVKKAAMYMGAGSAIIAKDAYRGYNLTNMNSTDGLHTINLHCWKARGVVEPEDVEYYFGTASDGRFVMGCGK